MKRFLLNILLLVLPFWLWANETDTTAVADTAQVADTTQVSENSSTKRVYKFDVKEEIGPPVWRKMQKAFEAAEAWQADLILLHMNTYGGMVIHADSMRTRILRSTIPVWVYIDNNAASAGALISISCDSIFMSTGANIGAATVVNQTGEQMPDKYQSYMRSTMRATAEAKGRDPQIAQAMVDESIAIDGISDSGKVLTFTTSEAMLHGFCEGSYESVNELLADNGFEDHELQTFVPSALETFIGWMVNPAVSGILIMIIIGGIYFELQSPGVGFPLAAAIIAALLYFTPLYLEGMAENWEVIIFLAGIILVGIEVFVLPGFGVAGISGALLIISSLVLSLVQNDGLDFDLVMPVAVFEAFFTVLIGAVGGFFLSIYLAKRMLSTSLLSSLVLSSVQRRDEGYIGVDTNEGSWIGLEGTAHTVLRPSGKVLLEGDIYDATAISGYIEKGATIKVIKHETAQLFVRQINTPDV